MTEPGRNDPCWCGSGKKYKKCHYLVKGFANTTNEPPFYLQLRVLEGQLQSAVKEYYRNEWGGDLILAAEKAFGRPKDGFSRDEQDNLICNWAMAPWSPDSDLGATLSEMYLEDHQDGIHPLGRKMIEALNDRPFSFIQIRAVDPGASMDVRDLLTGEEWKVMEQGGSRIDSVGRILYARVVTLDGISFMMGCGPYPFEPSHVRNIQNLREFINAKGSIKKSDLFENEETIRDVYLQLRQIHFHPQPPKMVNTDGDLLEFQTLEWRLELPLEDAIDPLLSLTLESRDEVLATCTKDKKGSIVWLEFHWSCSGHEIMSGLA